MDGIWWESGVPKRLLNGNGILKHGVHFCHLHDETSETVQRAQSDDRPTDPPIQGTCERDARYEMKRTLNHGAVCVLGGSACAGCARYYPSVYILLCYCCCCCCFRPLLCLHLATGVCFHHLFSAKHFSAHLMASSEHSSVSFCLCDNTLLRSAIRAIISQLISVGCRWW